MNVYEIVADKIIKQLEAGVIPWRKPWAGRNAPMNWVSQKRYRGINRFLLEPGEYVTYRQAINVGGYVKKGEKGNQVIFWKILEKESGVKEEKDYFPMLRYYTVFEISQCEGIERRHPDTAQTPEFSIIEEGEKILSGYEEGPIIAHGKDRASYSQITDTVNMPDREMFESESDYYSTIFHELCHSTGHKERLNREGIVKNTNFGDERYAFEELVAEFGSAMLCGIAGIDPATIDNSSAYISGWIDRLKREPKWLVQSASQAQRAADWIIGKRGEEGEQPEK